MQIKKFYLDLREGPQYASKSKDVWLLESEAFKEPLKFTFEFENEDLKDIKDIEESCKNYYDKLIQKEKEIDEKIKKLDKWEKKMMDLEKQIKDYFSEIWKITAKSEKIIENNKDVFHNIAQTLFKQDQKLNLLKDKIKEKKDLKISTYNQSLLIIWDDKYYGESIPLESGKYLIIEKIKYLPQNEFVAVEDVDPIQFKIEYIDKEYIPEFQIYSSNNVDNPVCKVEIEILFFQL